MDYFLRRDATLWAEEVALSDVAERFGTPSFVYSARTLERHVKALQQATTSVPTRLCYAVKANGNLSVLRLLAEAGCDFDAVSHGELLRVQAAGISPTRAILSGVGKTDQEIAAALQMKVAYLSVESREELAAIDAIAGGMGCVAPVSVRFNPNVDAATHPYITTGMANNKFGVAQEDLETLVRAATQMPHVALVGLTCHIGSQITQLSPFADAAHCLVRAVRQVQAAGASLQFVGMGGGLGIPYGEETPPTPAAYGACLAEILAPLQKTLVLEPGRVIVGNAGVLLTRVVRCKAHHGRQFVIVDAGMNDLLRPALYSAHHAIEVVSPRPGASEVVEVVGPVCESADAFARGLALSPLQPGDLLAMRSAGAYGFVMASTYNGRPKAAEVLCQGDQATLVGRREQREELWRLETIPPTRAE